MLMNGLDGQITTARNPGSRKRREHIRVQRAPRGAPS